MRVRVLRQFPYSTDGLTSAMKAVGEEFDCAAPAAPGLIAEKYVAPVEVSAAAGAPENQALPGAPENKIKPSRARG